MQKIYKYKSVAHGNEYISSIPPLDHETDILVAVAEVSWTPKQESAAKIVAKIDQEIDKHSGAIEVLERRKESIEIAH